MSNRAKWAHWKDPQPDRHVRVKNFVAGLIFLIVGLPLLFSGLEGLAEGKLWFFGFSYTYGKPTFRTTFDLLFLAGALIVAGVVLMFARD